MLTRFVPHFSRDATIIIGAVLLAGCSETPRPERNDANVTPAAPTQSQAASESTTRTSGPIKLIVGKAPDLRSAINSNKGKVVVVDFWATY